MITVTITTGSKNNTDLSPHITILPIPDRNQLVVTIPLHLCIQDNLTIELVNVLGISLKKAVVTSGVFSLPIRGLSSGTYFAILSCEGLFIEKQSIIWNAAD